MAREAEFQKKFISDLRKLGYKCYKQQMNATTRVGTPDLFIFKEQFWGMIEFKKSKNARVRPGQRELIQWANENSYGVFCYPENRDEVYNYLKEMAK